MSEQTDLLRALRDELMKAKAALRASVTPSQHDYHLGRVSGLETAHALLASASVPATKWHDIATAPKDMTRILAFAPDRLNPIFVVSWSNHANYSFNWNDGEYTYQPTHWMPLPAGPTGDGGEP